MKYIGTSLGGCLLSIMNGEVSEDDVMFIVTRTMCPTYEKFMGVVKAYHVQGNPYSRNPQNYDLNSTDLDKLLSLGERLYYGGKIHQPRVFAEEGGFHEYDHPTKYGHGLWLQIAPTIGSTTPAVVEAYEKYVMLDTLTRG